MEYYIYNISYTDIPPSQRIWIKRWNYKTEIQARRLITLGIANLPKGTNSIGFGRISLY